MNFQILRPAIFLKRGSSIDVFRTRLVATSEKPMIFLIYLKSRFFPNMFASWLSQIMLLFRRSY